VAFAARVVTRNPVWRDNLALWSATARVVPDDPTVVANLASALFEKGRYTEAESAARRALDLAERSGSRMSPVPVRLALGCSLFVRGDLDGALAEFQFAESRLPCRFDIDAAVHRNLGLIHDERGDIAAALAAYRKSAVADPFRADVWRKSSFCLLRLGEREAAHADWDRARRLDRSLPSFDEIEALYRQSRGGK
jgi:tetratricopeptide (TPR) repeat protein